MSSKMKSLEVANQMIKDEPQAHKKIIKRQAISVLIISIIFWSLYFARFHSTAKMQTKLDNDFKALGIPKIDYSIYDNVCLTGGKFADDQDM